jgi:hypothetical protein
VLSTARGKVREPQIVFSEIAGRGQRVLATVTQLRTRRGGKRNYHRRGNEKSDLHHAPCSDS